MPPRIPPIVWNPTWDADYEGASPFKGKIPEDEDSRIEYYMFLLEREHKTGRRGIASTFRKKYLPNLTPQEAIKRGKEILARPKKLEYTVVDTGKLDITIPDDIVRASSSTRYPDPYSTRGKTARPLASPRKSSLERVPVAVGPVQKAMSLASGRYSFYRDIYEREKDAGHINIEMKKRTEFYGKLSRDLKVLLDILNAETQAAFIGGIKKPQRARVVKRLSMLDRAMRMVVG